MTKWRLMYTNIKGMKGEKNSLIEILHDTNPHIFLLTETQLRSNIGMQIEGYKFYGREREGKIGGGVGILVRNDVVDKTTPHISNRNAEIMWISLHKNQSRPLFIGVYYGQQESRTSKNEIEMEMCLLKEEIDEMQNEGEILIIMDANAKIGLLGEEKTRNGRLILEVFQQTGLTIINNSEKCDGKITRKNTKNEHEISAIDFVVANQEAEKMVNKMVIDENGIYKVRGKNDTDHNTICVDIVIDGLNKTKVVRKTDWNLRASSEKWAQFGVQIEQRQTKAKQIITDKSMPFQERYNKWFNQLDTAARETIGKTTFKTGGKEKFSNDVKTMQQEKKVIKQQIRNNMDIGDKGHLIKRYKEIQDKVTTQIQKERQTIANERFERIAADKSKKTFWKEKKRVTRDPVLEALTIKDENGHRQFNPESVKEHTARYYEKLYQGKPFTPQPYHQEVRDKITEFKCNRDYENLPYNRIPYPEEVMEVINNKTNGKSTTDIKNEMLKRPGEKMVKFIYPLIKTIWEEELIPSAWNTGRITSIWKGKGDRENLENHRGITTSSSIGTILETMIDHRIEAQVPFTQAQGGGKKGSSCCDHLFILRSIIDLSNRKKQETFITFYDVSKAYDNADNDDMMKTIWECGLRGKTWRILKNLNSNLKAIVKTKHGHTREIEMDVGGRQGSSIMGRLFSKMMDGLAEKMLMTAIGYPLTPDTLIPALLWVDDVISCVIGETNQKTTLKNINQFGKDHKLRWGQDKCQVLRVGRHKNTAMKWEIGEMEIQETKQYKYLGDVITADGKNAKNLEARKNKMNVTTISIKTVAASETLNTIETSVLLEMHDTINLSSLLTNSEAWNLNRGEQAELERIEIHAIKLLFDLPIHTPTPALIFSFGLLYTTLRVEQRQLIYLWRVLNREQNHWTQRALNEIIGKNIGWGKTIQETLSRHDLPSDIETIKAHGRNEWTNKVKMAIEKANTDVLIKDCHKMENGQKRRKTKTAFIVDQIERPDYQRTPLKELLSCTKHETKTILMARYGMLECGKNYKGSLNVTCNECKEYDNEDHRMNHCVRYKSFNNHDDQTKVDFELVYNSNMEILKQIVPKIEQIWNVRNENGSMNVK